MTMADAERLFRHWASFPPVRVLVAGYMGFEPKSDTEPAKSYMSAEEFKQLVDSCGGRIDGIGRSHG